MSEGGREGEGEGGREGGSERGREGEGERGRQGGNGHNGRASQGKGIHKQEHTRKKAAGETCLEGSVYESTRAVPSTHLPWRRPHGACPHNTSKQHKEGMLVTSALRGEYGGGAQGMHQTGTQAGCAD